ncbi:alpha/beta hydrolase [Lelliottia aquatilis]|nr:alpha/beta hydrolase [Lelliottia aquatilis]
MGDAMMTKHGLVAGMIFSCSFSALATGVPSDAVIQDQQARYEKAWRVENGALTAVPPAPLEAYLATQPASQDMPVYDTLSSRDGLASLTQQHVKGRDEIARVINTEVILADRSIPVRIYSPSPDKPVNVIVFIHGGGHLSGSVDVYDPIARRLAATSGNTVVAVDYRRSPESPYPAGLNDARDVLLKVPSLLDEQHIPRGRQLTLAGDSGGGAFSATLAGEFQTTHTGYISRLVLIYPSLDYTLSWPSVHENGKGKLLDESKIAWYFSQYFRHKEDRHALSPLYRPVTGAFPPTLIFSGGLDPLRDENFAFVARLKAAGVPLKHVHFPGMVHAFLMLDNLAPQQNQQLYQDIASFVAAGPEKNAN